VLCNVPLNRLPNEGTGKGRTNQHSVVMMNKQLKSVLRRCYLEMHAIYIFFSFSVPLILNIISLRQETYCNFTVPGIERSQGTAVIKQINEQSHPTVIDTSFFCPGYNQPNVVVSRNLTTLAVSKCHLKHKNMEVNIQNYSDMIKAPFISKLKENSESSNNPVGQHEIKNRYLPQKIWLF